MAAAFEPLRETLRQGLSRVEALDVGRGFTEATMGVNQRGAFARLEAGWHPLQPLAVYGFGEVWTPVQTFAPQWQAGLGARVSW